MKMSMIYSTLCRQLPTYLRTTSQRKATSSVCSITRNVTHCQQSDAEPISPLILHPAFTPPQLLRPFPSSSSTSSTETILHHFDDVLLRMEAPKPENDNDTAQPPPNQGPSYDQLQAVHNSLVDSLSNIFVRPMNYQVYRQDLVFIDNIRGKRTNNLMQYMQQAALLRAAGHFKFAYVKFVILNTDISKEEARITVRWRIVGISALRVMLQFWRFKLWDWKGVMDKQGTWYDGVSYYDVDSDGLIYRHIADKMMIDKDKEVVVKTPKPVLAAGVLSSLLPETSLSTAIRRHSLVAPV